MDKRNQNYKEVQKSPFNKGAGARSATGGSLKNNSGITLIALVITIIVMLILVAVTISMAVNGGLFEYAEKAMDETQEAIDAEQKLADGKIKIGGKWYASIDDYINNKPITIGLEITPTEITLKKKETAEVEGEQKLTEVITASVFGMESEPEITWEVTPSDQTAITLSATSGKSVTVTAVGTEKTTATVTAKCTYEGEEYTAKSEVTLKILKDITIAEGAFVKYDVEYRDVYYDSYTYTSTNGWRLLSYDTDDGGETISNVELISTGVPAKLYYYYNSSADWWVTDTDKITAFNTALNNYYGDGTSTYTFYSDTGNNVYATAGMYYNFGNIPFYTESNYNAITTDSEKYNIGYYRSIEKNGTGITSNTDGSNLFLTSNDYSVRMLTLPEINNNRSDVEGMTISSTTTISSTHEPAAGLYILQNIKNISGLSSNAYSSAYYWLASPYVSRIYDAYHMNYHGDVSYAGSYPHGVRPVVNLGSDVTYTVDSDTDETTGITYLILTPEA